MDRKQIENEVIGMIDKVLAEKGLETGKLTLQNPVDHRLGLDSLDWASVIVQLESVLGVDPFLNAAGMSLSTIDDLVNLYDHALHQAG